MSKGMQRSVMMSVARAGRGEPRRMALSPHEVRVQDEVRQRFLEADLHVVTQSFVRAGAHEAGFDPFRSGANGVEVVLDGRH